MSLEHADEFGKTQTHIEQTKVSAISVLATLAIPLQFNQQG
jgi:hypothetical protein